MTTHAPALQVSLAPPLVECEERPDGSILLRSPVPLAAHEASVGEMLRRWVARAPERDFLAERDERGGWRRVSFAQAGAAADAIAQALQDRGLGPERPLMILSGNSVDHALLMLGGHVSGTPVVPVSTSYSLLSDDFAKLRHAISVTGPGLIYAADGVAFERALTAVDLGGAEVVVSRRPPAGVPSTPLDELLSARPTDEVARAFARVSPDSVAKVLFTSGSTDLPKGVIVTHRMLCANQQSIAQVWPFVADHPPVLVDWLPWNHTFGGNHNFNLVLKHGGTLYIDGGRPTPSDFDPTVANLREVSPTIYFNVPAGYAQLAARLEDDAALRETFFRRLRLIFYAGASLPQDLWERLERASVAAVGRRVLMTSSWGLTETAPACTAAHFESEGAGNIGIPLPGVTVKLVPNEDKLELRVKGPNVTSGYLGSADLTTAAFDEEGCFRTGDAARFVDPDDPSRGLLFDGRTVEDFKLSSGTFVHVGALRVKALAAASPVLQDAVVAGPDRPYVALLAWANPAGARQVASDEAWSTLSAYLRDRLREYNAAQPGSSTRIGRLLLLDDPASLDAGEITDKGYINQRAALRRRAQQLEELYAEPPGPRVIVIE